MKEMSIDNCKMCAANILRIVDQVCKENELDYFVFYGTLLGAVRHKGFIPWDDDIDIIMPRKDYDSLAQVMENNSYGLFFMRPENTSDTIYPHGKMIDTSTELYVHGYKHVDGYGVGIDIFPIDYLSNNRLLRTIKIKYALLLRKLIEHSASTTVEKGSSYYLTIKRYIAFYLTRVLDTNKLINKLNTLNIKNKPSSYYGVAWDRALPKELLFNAKRMPFEDFYVNVPNDSLYFLKELFGDYLKYPPVEEQVPKHHYDAYYK